MNIKRNPISVAGAFRTISLLFLVAFASSCAGISRSGDSDQVNGVNAPVEVSDEVSLRADRSHLADLRKDIPEDIKRENDELALVLELMSKGQEEPSKIRSRFNTVMRNRRDAHNKEMRKSREAYTKEERRARDAFLKALQEERNSFVGKKNVSSESRKRFFDAQDEKRKEYFANEREKRNEFESRINETRKTFEDYIRERTNDFNQEYRAYSSSYYERKKALDLKKRMERKARQEGGAAAISGVPSGERRSSANVLEDFKSIPDVPAIPLGASEP